MLPTSSKFAYLACRENIGLTCFCLLLMYSFYQSEDDCLNGNPFQMTTFLTPEGLTDDPDPSYYYYSDDLFAAGKEDDDFYVAGNDVGKMFSTFSVGDSTSCQFFEENYLSVWKDGQQPLATNVYVSALYGPVPPPTETPTFAPTSTAPTSTPTFAPTFAPTTGTPTIAPTTAPPTLAPTPRFGLMGFDYGKSETLSTADFDCMVDNGFEFFVQRGYVTWQTRHHGIENMVDPNLCTHLEHARRAGLDIKGVSVEPWPRYGVSYSSAVTSLKRHLVENCARFADVPVFLSVVDNGHINYGWRDSRRANRNWIEGFLTTCKKYFHACGVQSTRSVWAQLFHSASYFKSSVFDGVNVWYRLDGTKPNFKDFDREDVSFGDWSTPSMKQFQTNEYICDMVVGFDWSV
jgi:hypothetical protein